MVGEKKKERFFKVLDSGGNSCHGGSGKWSLPHKNEKGEWTPGDWMPSIEGDLEPCGNGYHLCREEDLVEWLGEAICEAEFEGECITAYSNLVVRKARLLKKCENWNDQTARLFACWCVRQVWGLLTDERSKRAVEVAERFANAQATREELQAAWDAAEDAAEDATGITARAAAWAAVRTAEDEAWRAALDAAEDAAWAAKLDAMDTVGDAAAKTDAGDAAEDAAKTAQTAKLIQILDGESM